MLDIEQIKKGLEDRNIPTVSERIGVHPHTLREIKKGTRVPAYDTLKAISDYLEKGVGDD